MRHMLLLPVCDTVYAAYCVRHYDAVMICTLLSLLRAHRRYCSRLLLLEIPCGLFQIEIALLVRSSGAKANADECGPRSSPKEKNGKDDTESETEGRFDEKVGQTAVPLVRETS